MQLSRKILSDLWSLIWDLESQAVALESDRAVDFCRMAEHLLFPPWAHATHPGGLQKTCCELLQHPGESGLLALCLQALRGSDKKPWPGAARALEKTYLQDGLR